MTEPSKPNIQFDDQGFLFDFIDVIKNVPLENSRNPFGTKKDPFSRSQAVDEDKVNYKNFIQLVDKVPYATMNRILAHDPNTLNDLTNDQMSALTPHIRIYKEEKVGNKIVNTTYPFGNFTSLESRTDSIIKSQFQRGVDAGIVNLSFKDLGTNPFNVGYAFNGTLELYFQSFHALFIDRQASNGKTVQFSEILDMTRMKGKQRLKDLEYHQISALNAPKGYEIKAEIGWNIAADPGKTLGFDIADGGITLRQRIENQKRTFLLHNIDQNLNVDSKDASVKLSIEFVASINAMAYAPRADLLYIDPNNESDPYAQKLSRLDESITTDQAAISALNKSTGELSQQLTVNTFRPSPANQGYFDTTEQETKQENENLSVALKEQMALRNELKKELEIKKAEKQGLAYKRIFNILREQLNGIRYVDLSEANIHSYLHYLKTRTRLFSGITPQKPPESEDVERQKGRLKSLRQQIRKTATTEASKTTMDRFNEKAQHVIKKLSMLTPEEAQLETSLGVRRVNYFFLGDLIEALTTVIYRSPTTNAKTGVTTQGKSQPGRIYQDIKFMCGTFDYTNPTNGQVVKGLAVSDIPVSWTYFNAWWTNEVTKINRQSYSLYNFLRDLCGKLINNLLNPQRVGSFKNFDTLDPTMQVIRIPNEAYVNKLWRSDKKKAKRRLTTEKVINNVNTQKRLDFRNSQEWFFLGVKGSPLHELTKIHRGKASDMRSQLRNKYRIPHFIVGGQSGLLKDISFKRMQLPQRREWAHAQQSSEVQQNLLFMDKYDATVTLIGSPIYAPGMLIYIDPVGFGLTPSLDKAAWATQLGIGGYYRIVRVEMSIDEKEFSTVLETIAELDFRDIAFANKKS